MPRAAFSHVDTWVFDLDNTLYPPEIRLFDQIEARMTAYVVRHLGVDSGEADRLRASYWADYGTTLAGLMEVNGIDPDPYLDDVHDICFDALTPDPDLASAIEALPGRKIVYTNGHGPYAERVLAARGLAGLFSAVYGVEHANYAPKPRETAFRTVFERDGLDPTRAAMFEDDARNLKIPKAMGLVTIHVAEASDPAPHIDHRTADLATFLQGLL
ncbi:MAG: pyrimidine 5'-nucleotidase [Pseudomonadota bacterium]